MSVLPHRAATTVLMVLGVLGTGAGARADITLVADARPAAVLVLGATPAWQDEFAAAELQRYIREMTGAELAVTRLPAVDVPATIGAAVLIGGPSTNPAVAELVAAGQVSLAAESLTDEGFVIRTVTWRERPAVVVAGVSDVGTVYAAYDLLERFGRVGFFRYEEHVPKRTSFVLPDCDVRERPHFPVRVHGGQYHYFGIHWFSEAQWHDELQWFAKNRQNRQNYLPGPPVTYLVEADMWQRLGVESAPRSESRDRAPGAALELVKRLTPYACRLGVRAPYPTTDGQIPGSVRKAFLAAHPDVKTVRNVRNHEDSLYVDPADPMWLKMNQTLLENTIEHFGDSRLYYLPSPWGERSPGDTPEEKERLTAEYAKALGRLGEWAQKEHAGAQWMLDGWAFANKDYWQPYRTRRLLESLPKELDLVIWDYPAQEEPSYVYNSYWHGRGWAFLVIHCMAGNTTVHGDVGRVLGETFRLLCDQRANHLVGYGNYTEARDYAPFFLDLLLHLSWDPSIQIDEFTQDYCERRYEADSVPAMVECHRKLIKTVYGPRSDTHMTDGFRTVRLQDPVYWFTLGANWVPFDELQRRVVELRRPWGPLLRDALADALTAAEREQDNAAYIRDLTDIMRSYVHVRINAAIWDAAEAANRGDVEAFEQHYAHIVRLFDGLLAAVGMVADRWEFSVTALVKDFEDAPLVYSPKEIRHYLLYVTWSGNQIHDYIRSDRYELIRDVHRPMTMAYFDAVRTQLTTDGKFKPAQPRNTGWEYGTIMDAQAVPAMAYEAAGPANKPIIDAYLKGPTVPPPPCADPIAVARAFLAAARAGEI